MPQQDAGYVRPNSPRRVSIPPRVRLGRRVWDGFFRPDCFGPRSRAVCHATMAFPVSAVSSDENGHGNPEGSLAKLRRRPFRFLRCLPRSRQPFRLGS